MSGLSVEPLYQGRTHGCGTAALAMALNALYDQAGRSERVDQAALDRLGRPVNVFSAPGMLADVARRLGFHAAVYHPVNAETVCRHIDAGHAVLALHSVDGTVFGLHYVLLARYVTALDGRLWLHWVDPAYRERPWRALPYEEFEQRFWPRLRWWGLDLGWERLIVVVSVHADLPPGDPPAPLLRLAHTVNRLLAGLLQWKGGVPEEP